MKRSRVRDYVLYVLISLFILVLLLSMAESGVSSDSFKKILGVLFFGLLPLGFVLERCSRYLKLPRFWFLLAGFGIIHCVVILVLFSYSKIVANMWSGMAVMIEMSCFLKLVNVVMGQPHLNGESL